MVPDTVRACRRERYAPTLLTTITKPHDAEVATVIYLPSWDSKESVDDYIQTTCGEQLDPILRAHPELTWAYYYPPSKTDWQQDSKVQCLLHDGNDAKLTGKLTK